MATRKDYLTMVLSVAGKVSKYIEDTIQSGDKAGQGSGKMVIFKAQDGAGNFATGKVIGTVVVNGKTYAVRHREVISLHPVDTTVKPDGGANVISL